MAAPKFRPAGRDAADHARLGRQRHQVDDALLGRHGGDAFGHADAEIDDALASSSSAARRAMILRSSHLQRLQRVHRARGSRRRSRRSRAREGLHVILRPLGDDDAVDQDARDLHLPRIQAAALGDALDLRDDEAAAVVRGHGDGQRLQRQRLALHGDVAVGIGGGAAHDADIDREVL